MQLSFKEHFQPIVFQKLWDWRLDKSCMKNHTYLLDHHQRSHYDSITIGPKGMMNWALQLNNSQSVNLFNSLVEKFNKQRSPNFPNQKPKPICDRSGKRDNTEDVLVVKDETSRSYEIDEKGLHEELGSSDRSEKPDKLSANIRVKHAHDGTGQLVEQTSSSAHNSERTICSWRKSWHCVI